MNCIILWLLFGMGHTHVTYINLYISVPLTILMLNVLVSLRVKYSVSRNLATKVSESKRA